MHLAEYADSILLNVSAIIVDDDCQLNLHVECREKAVYIYGTLQVHFIECLMSDMKCKLKFYMISLSNNILNEKECNCPGSLTVMESYYPVITKINSGLGKLPR